MSGSDSDRSKHWWNSTSKACTLPLPGSSFHSVTLGSFAFICIVQQMTENSINGRERVNRFKTVISLTCTLNCHQRCQWKWSDDRQGIAFRFCNTFPQSSRVCIFRTVVVKNIQFLGCGFVIPWCGYPFQTTALVWHKFLLKGACICFETLARFLQNPQWVSEKYYSPGGKVIHHV